MKKTLKSQVLDYVESLGNDASYTQIVSFAHDCKHGSGSWLLNENRRGWLSDAFAGQWIYFDPNGRHFPYRTGYFVKRGVKSGWLEKKSNRKYKTVRP